ncbi:MAG: hypothetical protein RL266_402 [Bacteroidota bacterium]|jgi:hypothetical protein
MKHINLFLIGTLLLVSFVLNSCSSTSISKLEGQWQLFWINDLTDENIYIWNFEGGELTIIKYTPPTPANPNPQPVIGGRAQYKTSAEFLDAVVEISGFVYSLSDPKVIPQLSNGKWTIDKIDDDVMRLATADQEGANGSYVIREFTRVK